MPDTYKHSYKALGESLLHSLSVYNAGYQKCEPGYQWGPGVRDHYCIHHILSGRGTYTVQEKSRTLVEGDTFILYPGTEVCYRADEEQPWEYGWAGFMGSDAPSLIRNTGFTREEPFIRGGRIPSEQIRHGLKQIYDAQGSTYEAAVAMTGAMYSLLALFMHYCPQQKSRQDMRLDYVKKAQAYFETNYSYPITVEDAAAYVGISRSHLYRSFRLYMNCSPKDFLTEYRISQACRLLKETPLAVSSIAYSVGFENGLYFSKAFRKSRGKSPTEYRQEHAHREEKEESYGFI